MRVQDLIIPGEATLIDALKQLDKTGQRILFIAPEGVLQAVLTDGDVRKAILRGVELESPVSDAANYAPVSLPLAQRGSARAEMQRRFIDAIPILDKEGRIADIAFANDFDVVTHKMVDLPVVIMAGGLGTRLYPYTKILPKPLIPIGDTPILELILNKFHDFGCTDFRLVVNYKRNMIKGYFNEVQADYAITYVDEDEPLGTGGGLCLLKGKIDRPFFLANCDTLIEADYADMVKYHERTGNDITMVCVMKHFTIPYGVVEMDEEGALTGISEKPEMNLLTNAGMYIVNPDVVENIEDGVKQGFPDIMEQVKARGGRVGVYPISDGSWMDMGQLEELEKMRRRLEGQE